MPAADPAVLQVACACGSQYLPHAAAMLRSLLDHERDVHVHLLHPPRTSSRALRAVAGMVTGAGAGFTAQGFGRRRLRRLPDGAEHGFSHAVWLRMFLPEVLEAPRVLYLDCDILVRDTLGDLWATDLGGGYIGAVQNLFEEWDAGRPARLGLAPADYLNSGVLLMDLDAMRRDRIAEELYRQAVERAHELTWLDQDTLSVVLAGRWHHLHPRYNAMNSLARAAADTVFGTAAEEARRAPAIRHFEGPVKPWHAQADPVWRAAYAGALARTPFSPG